MYIFIRQQTQMDELTKSRTQQYGKKKILIFSILCMRTSPEWMIMES